MVIKTDYLYKKSRQTPYILASFIQSKVCSIIATSLHTFVYFVNGGWYILPGTCLFCVKNNSISLTLILICIQALPLH